MKDQSYFTYFVPKCDPSPPFLSPWEAVNTKGRWVLLFLAAFCDFVLRLRWWHITNAAIKTVLTVFWRLKPNSRRHLCLCRYLIVGVGFAHQCKWEGLRISWRGSRNTGPTTVHWAGPWIQFVVPPVMIEREFLLLSFIHLVGHLSYRMKCETELGRMITGTRRNPHSSQEFYVLY